MASAVEANEQAFTALSKKLSRMSAHLDLAAPPAPSVSTSAPVFLQQGPEP